MYHTSDIRKGLKVEFAGEPYIVIDFQFVKPGKGNAFTRTRFKSMITGRVLDKTLKSGESLTPAELEDRNMQYLYTDGSTYSFMDNDSYEQVEIDTESMGDAINWLAENMDVDVLFHAGKAVNIELPNFVEMNIKRCEPGVKGNTATGATKPATMPTGAIVNVPLFIEEGEKIRIDTRTGEYVGRAKS